MDKYLLQILLDTNTIIIPDLGALTVTNEKTGEIMFMSYLKYDDGKLATYISEKENIPENEAKNIIAKHVRDINAKLDQGQSYDMFQFGRFFKSKAGDIEFEKWGLSTSSDSPVTPPAVVEVEIIEEITPPVEEVAPEIEIITEEKIVETPGLEIPDEIENNTSFSDEIPDNLIPVATETTKEEKIQVENSYTPPVGNEKESDTASFSSEKTSTEDIKEEKVVPVKEKPVKEKSEKKKRSGLFWALIVIIILFLGLGLSSVLFYDQMKKIFPFLESKRTEIEKNPNKEIFYDSLNESAEDLEKAETERLNVVEENLPVTTAPEETKAIVTEKTAESQQKPAPIVKTPPPVAPVEKTTSIASGGSYHIVGGAFSEESNANRYAEKLKTNGNNATVLGRYDNLYIVSIESYNSLKEANQALAAKTSISGKAWVFKTK